MAAGSRHSNDYAFRGVEYVISTEITKGEPETELLVIEVEDKMSAEQWRGEFEPRYIEELTHKTGNFKQFSVFCSMLQSAAAKSSGSVSLDLLTFEDLERLRSRQRGKATAGQGSKRNGGHSSPGNKKYLILTYSVEFDRIHYPLPLPYQGKPDPVGQQATIRKLRSELEQLRRQLARGNKHSDVGQLQSAYEDLLKEKEELEEAFDKFRHDVKLSQAGNASKEVQVLKKVIRNLEADLLNEKTKYQRSSRRKSDENRGLLLELEELRTSERNLRIRVKSLTNELATLKRGRRAGPSSGSKPVHQSRSRQRSLSWERQPRPRSRSREDSGSQRKPFTPSPAGARCPRFNPTAYVKDKRQKQKDADLRLGRAQVKWKPRPPRSRSNSSERLPTRSQRLVDSSPAVASSGRRRRHRQPNRTSSVGSAGSGRSSRDSSLERSESSIGLDGSSRGRTRWSRQHAWPSSDFAKKPTRRASTPKQSRPTKQRLSGRQDVSRDEEYAKRSAEISEIDARLNALKRFMKSSMET
eukprot:m.3929 g.3929  ORF g.3929 m.3929 type:complete len:526 (+) comp9991_c0_seq1:95-1672(+)